MHGLLLFGDTVRSAALRHEIPIAIIDTLHGVVLTVDDAAVRLISRPGATIHGGWKGGS